MNPLKEKASILSSLGADRLDVLAHAIDATQAAGGEIWECGVWRGGTSLWMKAHMNPGMRRVLRMFDTFAGLPYSGDSDVHKVGAMSDTSHSSVVDLFVEMQDCFIHRGVMPATFAGLEACTISVAHIDVDQHESVKACLEFIYPRVHSGGYIILDDYGCGSCPGAKLATDQFLSGRPERLITSSTPGCPQVYFIKK